MEQVAKAAVRRDVAARNVIKSRKMRKTKSKV